MFRGEFEHSLDDKGRIILPSRLREALGDVAIVGRGIDGQLNLYAADVWENVAQRLSEQNMAHSVVRDMVRVLFSVMECPVDRQGRIVIPANFRRYADLDTNVVILGMNDHIELWDQKRWLANSERIRAEGSEISEKLAELGFRL